MPVVLLIALVGLMVVLWVVPLVLLYQFDASFDTRQSRGDKAYYRRLRRENRRVRRRNERHNRRL